MIPCTCHPHHRVFTVTESRVDRIDRLDWPKELPKAYRRRPGSITPYSNDLNIVKIWLILSSSCSLNTSAYSLHHGQDLWTHRNSATYTASPTANSERDIDARRVSESNYTTRWPATGAAAGASTQYSVRTLRTP